MIVNHLHLSLKNQAGSVQHYFHFLLGFMVPLVIRLENDPPPKPSKISIRSCGPMDRHLISLKYSQLNIIPPLAHKIGRFNPFITCETLPGFDAVERYDKSALSAAAKIIKARLNVKSRERTGQLPKVVAINRSVDRFYNTRSSEIKDSGAQRRSIPNFGELEKHLSSTCPDYNSLILEEASLAQQIGHFQSADVIIAQHGAALANLIFSKPGAKIIEILPPNHPGEYFSRLAECLGLNYCCYHQKGPHEKVNPQELAALLP